MTATRKESVKAWCCDLIAGLTAAFALLPGLILVPLLLNEGGMNFKGAFSAYVIMSIAGTLVLSIFRRPLVAGTSLVLTYYLVYLGIVANGLTWNQLLGISLVVSCLGAVLFLSPLGRCLLQAIPKPVRKAMPLGIGVMLIWIGLVQGRIFLASPWSVTMLGNFQDPLAYLSLVGIVLTVGLMARKWKISLLLGGVVTAIIALNEGFWEFPTESFIDPEGLDKVAGFLDVWAVQNSQYPTMFAIGLTMLLVLSSMQIGTLSSSGDKKEGREVTALFALSAIGSFVGSLPLIASPLATTGTSLAKNGRRASIFAALLLLLALYMEPALAAMADFPVMTVPVLVGGGLWLLASHLSDLSGDFCQLENLLPMVCVVLIMPLSFNMAAGIGAGIISHVLIKTVQGDARRLSPGTWALTVLFAFYFVYGTI